MDVMVFYCVYCYSAAIKYLYFIECWLSLVLGGSKESASGGTKPKDETDGKKQETTWVHELFQGQTTNETKCLNCETVRYHKSSLVWMHY